MASTTIKVESVSSLVKSIKDDYDGIYMPGLYYYYKDGEYIKDMSDDEIRNKINRIKLERELQSLTPKEVSKGKQFVDSLAKDVITPAAKNVGRQYLEKTMKDLMGLNEKQTKDSFDALKKEVDTLELKKRKAVAEDYLNKRKEKQESENQNKQSSKNKSNDTKSSLNTSHI